MYIKGQSGLYSVQDKYVVPVSCIKVFYKFGCVSGGWGYEADYRAEILEWNDEEQEWVEVDKMKAARNIHAVSTIQLDIHAVEGCSYMDMD